MCTCMYIFALLHLYTESLFVLVLFLLFDFMHSKNDQEI